MKENHFRVPTFFEPRPYQYKALQALDGGIKRAYCVWHRRSGKDITFWNFVLKNAVDHIGMYAYILPTYTQGRKIIWDGIDGYGRRFLHHMPEELISRKNESDMKLYLQNGSIIQILGADAPDSLRGINPCGIVLSEFAFMRPDVWEVLQPILQENNGWAVFITTPNGRNHAFKMWQSAQKSSQWYTSLQSIDDTYHWDKKAIIDPLKLKQEIPGSIHQQAIEREYFCRFDVAQEGTFYSHILEILLHEGRIDTGIEYIPDTGVDTFWDLGIADKTAIWFTQCVGKNIHIIDHIEGSGQSLSTWLETVEKKEYSYGTHYFPHDIRIREFGSGVSREQLLREKNIPYKIVPKTSLEEGIHAAQSILPLCVFHAQKCATGLEALWNYRRAKDGAGNLRSVPEHDANSHSADAFRYLAVSFLGFMQKQKKSEATATPFSVQKPKINNRWSPL